MLGQMQQLLEGVEEAAILRQRPKEHSAALCVCCVPSHITQHAFTRDTSVGVINVACVVSAVFSDMCMMM